MGQLDLEVELQPEGDLALPSTFVLINQATQLGKAKFSAEDSAKVTSLFLPRPFLTEQNKQ